MKRPSGYTRELDGFFVRFDNSMRHRTVVRKLGGDKEPVISKL